MKFVAKLGKKTEKRQKVKVKNMLSSLKGVKMKR
jgi:hypothetical protein